MGAGDCSHEMSRLFCVGFIPCGPEPIYGISFPYRQKEKRANCNNKSHKMAIDDIDRSGTTQERGNSLLKCGLLIFIQIL